MNINSLKNKVMRKKSFTYYTKGVALALMIGVLAVSCKKDDVPAPNPLDGGQFVIAASSGEASYLLQSDTIDQGEVSIVGNGVEAESATHWLFPQNKYAYGLQYRQGSAGITNSYILDENNLLEMRTAEFEMPRFTAFGTYEQYVLLGAAAATDQFATEDTEKVNPKYGITFTTVDAEQQAKYEYNLVTENLTGDGEYHTLSGFVGVNNKMYTALIPVGTSAYGVSQGSVASENEDLIAEDRNGNKVLSGTVHPNVVRMAIFNGVDGFDAKPTIVEDDRISYATGRFRSQYYPMVGLSEDESYIYVFSNSYARSSDDIRQRATLPAGVIRLNTATNEFDPNYYYNVESATGGYLFFNVWPILGGGDKFIMRMYDEPGDDAFSGTMLSMGIFDALTGEYKKVTGLPSLSEFIIGDASGSIGRFVYSENGMAYITVTTVDGKQPAVYVINSETAVATRGITVVADGGISAIGKLIN